MEGRREGGGGRVKRNERGWRKGKGTYLKLVVKLTTQISDCMYRCKYHEVSGEFFLV
jgi:hypothetical protein